ncbi:Peptide transporter, putative [Perkinsus marinus ATCC 50983]|uniref:Peptide transporter, putative n=2 Tax=Perkinsus marinus (strain ATCC 50983 / TXsc) TaxID=423536 RepID=C5KFL7_PERM5|nr:Peptide transporter, putative [Perkinsus marinus ATCC 50983]EER16766.1 Peptide transporter, putative [Perkinsus marinus ATCC 50983]|eukprot:XP_002784970.1 Peptide transporter, putative [Perkinsus marinus ATCC 50983]
MVVKRDSLSWTDSSGNIYHYYQRPMLNGVIFILLQEFCERLAFFGITPNAQTFFKEYLNYTDAEANSYIATFQAILYVTPLFAAVLSDTILGVYVTILSFSVVYMIGLILLLLSTVKSISAPWMIHLSVLVLITLGGGGIKSCVNVMGAHQFHPDYHKESLTSYYTYFYAAINVGSLIGGIATPIVLQEANFTAAFAIPLGAFVVATVVFVCGGLLGRFVKPKPQGSAVLKILQVMFNAIKKCSLEKNKKTRGGQFEDGFIEDVKALLRLIPLFSLIIPFVIAYVNLSTAYLTQAQKMDRRLFNWKIPAALMQNVDPIAVVINSILISSILYPLLKRRGIVLSVLLRSFIGSVLGVVSLVSALIVELQIKSRPLFTVSIWWQVVQFWLVAAGEIFLISTSYEIAFTLSPSSLKAVASAVNLLFFAVGYALSGVIFQLCAPWLPNFDPANPTVISHKGAHYEYFYLVLIALCSIGAAACLALMPYFKRVAKANRELLEAVRKEEVTEEDPAKV